MSRLVIGLGGVFILLGLWVLILPDQVVSIVDWESRQGVYVAAAMRIVTGLILLLSASATRYPKGLRIFGVLILLAGLGLLFIPVETWSGLIRWWLVENLVIYRVCGGFVGMLVGIFLVHAALPRRSAD
ncbi:hypothetical protein N9971_00410 [bacterium]|nr:hypothetical protein [bacterium]